ncbi:hypothetical protein QWJ07_30955 [Frankia sp. RB7]|nr:hypothetical protein [Frankia sp. RB7]
MTDHTPLDVLRICRDQNSFEPLAALAPDEDTRAWLLSIPVKPDDDPVVDATRASTILREDHKWDVAARRAFIVRHILHVDNTTSQRIAAGQNGGVKAAMDDRRAVDAMRARIKALM